MKKILYFEDEQWFADVLVKEMMDQPYWLFTPVTTPTEFFKEIKGSCQIDLFILDIMAPMKLFTETDLNELSEAQQRRLNEGLNIGVVFYEKIRELEKFRKTPILFYTSKNDPNLKNDKNVTYISKPSDSKSIIAIIHKLFNDSEL